MSYPINNMPPSDALSGVINNIGNAVNAGKTTVGNGLKISKRHDGGTHIELEQQMRPNYNTYTTLLTNYDPTLEYWPGQQVLVDNRLTYTDSYTNPSSPTLTFGNSGSNISGIISQGTFICIAYVPPAWNSASVFINNIVPAYKLAGGTANDNDAQHYRWNGMNYYYPLTPNIQLNNQSANSSSGFIIQTGVCYWLPLGNTGGGSSTGLTYRGYWNPTTTYTPNSDLVILGTGVSGGGYIALTNSSGSAPDSLIGWGQFPPATFWS